MIRRMNMRRRTTRNRTRRMRTRTMTMTKTNRRKNSRTNRTLNIIIGVKRQQILIIAKMIRRPAARTGRILPLRLRRKTITKTRSTIQPSYIRLGVMPRNIRNGGFVPVVLSAATTRRSFKSPILKTQHLILPDRKRLDCNTVNRSFKSIAGLTPHQETAPA